MICLKCKQEINENSKFCIKCGSPVPRCPSCGMVLTKKVRYCTQDGKLIPDSVLVLFDEISSEKPDQPQRIVTPQRAREIHSQAVEQEKFAQKRGGHRILQIILFFLLIIMLAVSGIASYKIITFETIFEIEETVSEQVLGYEGKDAI